MSRSVVISCMRVMNTRVINSFSRLPDLIDFEIAMILSLYSTSFGKRLDSVSYVREDKFIGQHETK